MAVANRSTKFGAPNMELLINCKGAEPVNSPSTLTRNIKYIAVTPINSVVIFKFDFQVSSEKNQMKIGTIANMVIAFSFARNAMKKVIAEPASNNGFFLFNHPCNK